MFLDFSIERFISTTQRALFFFCQTLYGTCSVCDVKVVTKTPCLEKDWKILFRFVKCCFVCFKFIRANRNAFFLEWRKCSAFYLYLVVSCIVIWIHQWRILKIMLVNQFQTKKKLNIITLLYIHYVYDYDRLSVAISFVYK